MFCWTEDLYRLYLLRCMDAYVRKSDPLFSRNPKVISFSFFLFQSIMFIAFSIDYVHSFFSIDYVHIFFFLLTLMFVLGSCADNFVLILMFVLSQCADEFILILILYLSFNNFPSLHLLCDFIRLCCLLFFSDDLIPSIFFQFSSCIQFILHSSITSIPKAHLFIFISFSIIFCNADACIWILYVLLDADVQLLDSITSIFPEIVFWNITVLPNPP